MPELPHNIYLQQWVNNGLPGLISYLAFLGVRVWTFLSRRYFPGVMLIVVAIVGGFFSHNILDQRPFLILYGLLLGGSGRGVRGG
jgi:O-antigen ligase